ncbi:hypothetical protein GCM10028798_33000 [Humibacter antri]
MTSTPRKPLWRWDPAPYVLLLILLIVTSSIPPLGAPVLYWALVAITALVALVLVVLLVAQLARGRRNPDAAGILSSLDGLELVRLAASAAPATPVVETRRHQGALESVLARVGENPEAVLVPDATRWLGLRIRIAVHLVAGGRVHHVGFLPDRSTQRYNAGLRALAARHLYVCAPSTVISSKATRSTPSGTSSVLDVQLDLGSLADVVDQAST